MKQGFENLTKKNEELEAEVTSLKNNVSYLSIRCPVVLFFFDVNKLSPEIQNLQKAVSFFIH